MSLIVQDTSRMPFMGRFYTVRVKKALAACSSVQLAGGVIEVTLYGSAKTLLTPVLKDWYKEMAAHDLKERTAFWCAKMHLAVRQIRIKDQKTRWGSCSSLGNINYNWRIIMSPPEVIDYLVIHELSHLVHMNHSQGFWRLVAQYSPQHKKCRTWLKENAGTLLHCI